LVLGILAAAVAGTVLVDRSRGRPQTDPPTAPRTIDRDNLPEGTSIGHLLVPEITAGTPVPDLTLPDAEGGPDVHLVSYRGKRPVVLVFGSFS
jgi:hypothetical protein